MSWCRIGFICNGSCVAPVEESESILGGGGAEGEDTTAGKGKGKV